MTKGSQRSSTYPAALAQLRDDIPLEPAPPLTTIQPTTLLFWPKSPKYGSLKLKPSSIFTGSQQLSQPYHFVAVLPPEVEDLLSDVPAAPSSNCT